MVAAIEFHQSAAGFYTTWPSRYFDKYAGVGFGQEPRPPVAIVLISRTDAGSMGCALVMFLARRCWTVRRAHDHRCFGAPVWWWCRDIISSPTIPPSSRQTLAWVRFLVNHLAFLRRFWRGGLDGRRGPFGDRSLAAREVGYRRGTIGTAAALGLAFTRKSDATGSAGWIVRRRSRPDSSRAWRPVLPRGPRVDGRRRMARNAHAEGRENRLCRFAWHWCRPAQRRRSK